MMIPPHPTLSPKGEREQSPLPPPSASPSRGRGGGLVPIRRNLPALPVREAEEVGALILTTLDRMGFVHRNRDGTCWTVCFESADVWGDRWASFVVDVQRLWHTAVADLASPKVKTQLEAATRREVRIVTRPSLMYAVRLRPAHLPEQAELDLRPSRRPGGRSGSPLAVPIGRGRAGDVWRDLPSLGHTLIMGASGAGKSSWLHCALAALLSSNKPERLQVVLIDPKQMEFAAWRQVPHLRGPVAVEIKTAVAALASLVAEVDRRSQIIAEAGARDLAGYNRQAGGPTMPHILAVIDECLDLTLQAGNRSELANLLKRLASKARATGVILWLAATHGTADILPRVVSVNLSSRIVLRVQDAAAARLAGCPGAERIARDKPGRLLARLDSETLELQGYYLPDDRLAALAAQVCSYAERDEPSARCVTLQA
ncbi:MAG: DNA translocase FtsK [Thermoflexales bacterium]|nr:DNA translocase FtsK [Thermoflexales bacterium]